MENIDASAAGEIVIPKLGIKTYLAGAELEDSFNFECQRCGSCCRHPSSMNPNELNRAAKYLNISNAEFFNGYTEMQRDPTYGWKVKLRRRKGHCIFFKGGSKASCEIYEARPRQCRAKPLVGLDVKGRDLESMIFGIEPCKGLGKGPEYTVLEWIKMRGLEPLWKEETEYFRSIESLKLTENEDRLMMIIRNLFT